MVYRGAPVNVAAAPLQRQKDGVFYDLGCGTGKPVFVAAAVHPWQRCIGMEILADLHAICLKVLQVCVCVRVDVLCVCLLPRSGNSTTCSFERLRVIASVWCYPVILQATRILRTRQHLVPCQSL